MSTTGLLILTLKFAFLQPPSHADGKGFPGGASGKNLPANAGDSKRRGFDPWVGKIP